MREIGSDFWLDYNEIDSTHDLVDIFPLGDDRVYLLSGRSAIDFVIDDIPKEIRAAYMPSYCCSSMLQPFANRDIDISFYDVTFDSGGIKYVIDYSKDVDIFFANSYFGFQCTIMDMAIGEFKNRNVTVLEDITHRLLCKQNYCKRADYVICSLRKWFPIPSGGLAVKVKGYFRNAETYSPPAGLIEGKVNAMLKKSEYMKASYSGNYGQIKQEHLTLYHNFNQRLRTNYKRIKMDNLSRRLLSKIDIVGVRKRRKNNAGLILDGLKGLKHIKPLIMESDFSTDCPLFVPVLVNTADRRKMVEYLVNKGVYCPIHWPVPENVFLNRKTAIPYERELSLICDQRYSIKEIGYQVNLLREFENTI